MRFHLILKQAFNRNYYYDKTRKYNNFDFHRKGYFMTQKSLFLGTMFIVFMNQMTAQTIILKSDVIKIADGTFIDANTIEFMRKFRRKILDIVLGETSTDGKRIGQYTVEGKGHGIQYLALYEQGLLRKYNKNKKKLKQLQLLLVTAKIDFVIISEEFMHSARGAKGILITLIQEDCQKRKHPNSLLLEWAQTGEGQETAMFNQRITNFIQYYSLCRDLLNFLSDLIASCPKAEKQFKERVDKWSKVKVMLPEIIKQLDIPHDTIYENKFLRHLKENHLDSFTIQNITSNTIQKLLIEYIKPTLQVL